MQPPRPEDYGLTPTEVEEIKSWIEDKSGCTFYFVWTVLCLVATAVVGDLGLILLLLGIVVAFAVRRLQLPLRLRSKVRSYRRLASSQEKYARWFARTQWEFWDRLSGLQFEREVAALLSRAGQAATLTPPSGDHGVDVLLGDGTVVQCKAWSKPVGPGAVRELYGTMKARGAGRAILVGKNGFTRGARDFARGKNIELWDASRLIVIQRQLETGPPSEAVANRGQAPGGQGRRCPGARP